MRKSCPFILREIFEHIEEEATKIITGIQLVFYACPEVDLVLATHCMRACKKQVSCILNIGSTDCATRRARDVMLSNVNAFLGKMPNTTILIKRDSNVNACDI